MAAWALQFVNSDLVLSQWSQPCGALHHCWGALQAAACAASVSAVPKAAVLCRDCMSLMLWAASLRIADTEAARAEPFRPEQ